MDVSGINNVSLEFLKYEDYEELKTAMISAYKTMPNAYWKGYHIQTLIEKFPEGQIIIRVNNQLAGCALSIVIDYNQFGENHTYREITGNFTFSTHDEEGDMLYGVDVFIKPEFRGLRFPG